MEVVVYVGGVIIGKYAVLIPGIYRNAELIDKE